MDEFELKIIALMEAEFITKVTNGNIDAGVVLQPIFVQARKHALAISHATATNRSFESVLEEVELAYVAQLGKILMKGTRYDPVLQGLKSVVVVDRDGEVCGICLEEMVQGDETKAMDCMHRFHPCCIVKWLQRKKNTCPLCRYHQM